MPKQFGIEEITERPCPMCQGVMHRVEPTDGTRRHFRCERCTHTVGRTPVVFYAVLAVTAIVLLTLLMLFASEFLSSLTSSPAGSVGVSLG